VHWQSQKLPRRLVYSLDLQEKETKDEEDDEKISQLIFLLEKKKKKTF